MGHTTFFRSFTVLCVISTLLLGVAGQQTFASFEEGGLVSAVVTTDASGYMMEGGTVYYLGADTIVSVQVQADVPLLYHKMSVDFSVDADGDVDTDDDRTSFKSGSDRITTDGEVFSFHIREGDTGYLFYTISNIADTDGHRHPPLVSADRSYRIDTSVPYIIGSSARVFRDGVLVDEGVIQVGDDIHVSIETSEPVAALRAFSPFLLSQDRVVISGSADSINAVYTYQEQDTWHVGGNRFLFYVNEAQDLAGNRAEGVSDDIPYIVMLFNDTAVFETGTAYADRTGRQHETAPLVEQVDPVVPSLNITNPIFAPQL